MTASGVVRLAGRAVIAIGGADAFHFLDRLVTAAVDRLAAGAPAVYGSLLTPQGKIFTDFILLSHDGGYLLDCPAGVAPDLLKRLSLYRLRAAVTLADITANMAVAAAYGSAELPPGAAITIADPRLAALGHRLYGAPAAIDALSTSADEDGYRAHRVALAVPAFGEDFAASDAFPHDVAMDDLGGVVFDKGCYVGQEVVSRMQYRGTARRRPVAVSAEGPLPATGTELMAGSRAAGTLGSVAGSRAIAIARLDRLADAMAAGTPITAGGLAVTVALPAYAKYGWPATGAED